MSYSTLDVLLDDDFVMLSTFYSTPSALYRQLARCPEIAGIKEAIRDGVITDAMMRRFVEDLCGDLRQGERFIHDPAIAALAVILEDRSTPFAVEFLESLASLDCAEMSLSRGVSALIEARRTSASLTPDRPSSAMCSPRSS